MIGTDGRVRVTDFGLVSSLGSAVSLVAIGESRLELRQAAEAVAPLERAVAILSADPTNPRLAQARRALSRATRQR